MNWISLFGSNVYKNPKIIGSSKHHSHFELYSMKMSEYILMQKIAKNVSFPERIRNNFDEQTSYAGSLKKLQLIQNRALRQIKRSK